MIKLFFSFYQIEVSYKADRMEVRDLKPYEDQHTS